ncbi:hypothetical protein Tco_0471381 [Tanacetum coccineum]
MANIHLGTWARVPCIAEGMRRFDFEIGLAQPEVGTSFGASLLVGGSVVNGVTRGDPNPEVESGVRNFYLGKQMGYILSKSSLDNLELVERQLDELVLDTRGEEKHGMVSNLMRKTSESDTELAPTLANICLASCLTTFGFAFDNFRHFSSIYPRKLPPAAGVTMSLDH